MKLTKMILPVIVGAMVGVVSMNLGEVALHHSYPLPAGIAIDDKHAVTAAIGQVPARFFGLLLINYCICSFIAGISATLVAGRHTAVPAVVTGLALTLSGIANALMLPQPLWFSVVSILCYLPFAYGGYLTVRRPSAGAAGSL